MPAPLPERMRPRTLEDFIGQPRLLGRNGALKRALENNLIPSMILWGPPGVGKTTLALLIAETTKRVCHSLSAISSGVKRAARSIGKTIGVVSSYCFY